MEKYLQDLVITIPSLMVSMGGILIMVWMCLRSWGKGNFYSSKHATCTAAPPLHEVTTQADQTGASQLIKKLHQGEMQQVLSIEMREKLVEEVMARVKVVLADRFRKQQVSTMISREEFNNLYRQKLPSQLHSASIGAATASCVSDTNHDKRKRHEIEHMSHVDEVQVITTMGPALPSPASSQELAKSDSFAALWVEELQRNSDYAAARKGKASSMSSGFPEVGAKVPVALPMPPPAAHTVITCDPLPSKLQDNGIAARVGKSKGHAELKSLQDLEMFLLTTSSNLCRSIMTFSSSSAQMLPGKELMAAAGGSNGFGGLVPSGQPMAGPKMRASTSTTSAPQLLKGGGPFLAGTEYANEHTWRFDIEEKEAVSPPNTPRRRTRSPTHLCRGVNFEFKEHPPTLNLIDLDPEQGYGWRGPYWKHGFEKYNFMKPRKGPSKYRPTHLKSNSDDGVRQYYKEVEEEASRRWARIRARYKRAKEVQKLKRDVHEEIEETKAWRENLRRFESQSSSSGESNYSGDGGGQTTEKAKKKKRRVKSMLTSSSSSSSISDGFQNYKRATNPANACRMKHRHCPYPPRTSS